MQDSCAKDHELEGLREGLLSAFEKITRGAKPSLSDFTTLQKSIYTLTNRPVTASSTSLPILPALSDLLTSCVSFILETHVFPLLQPLLSTSPSSTDLDLLHRVWSSTLSLQTFLSRLLQGRYLFLTHFPSAPALPSLLFQKFLSSSPSLLASLPIDSSKPQSPSFSLPQPASPPAQPPLPRHRFTRTKNLIEYFPSPFIPDSTFTFSSNSYSFPYTSAPLPFFLIHPILSSSECDQLISKSTSELSFKTLAHEFPSDQRDNSRILLNCPELSSTLWQRLSSIFTQHPESFPFLSSLCPFGFNTLGKWEINSLNTVFRVCLYIAPSVGFKPHRDSNFVKSDDARSIFTLMIYLNDDFEGGDTIFFESIGERGREETIDEEIARNGGKVKEAYRLRPRKGLAVCFDHDMLHEGEDVRKGKKVLIRTDVVFVRNEHVEEEGWEKNPEYLKSVWYYKNAADAECAGDTVKSSEYYERGLALRQYQRNKNVS